MSVKNYSLSEHKLQRRVTITVSTIFLCIISFFLFAADSIPSVTSDSSADSSSASEESSYLLPTHFYVLLDRSGSMQNLANDVVGGINSYIAEQQKQELPSLITLIQFHSSEPQQVIFDAQPIKHTRPLGPDDYRPGGRTPLYDAIGATVRRAEKNSRGQKENVVIIIFSDGEENNSRRDNQFTVTKMIEEKKEEGWAFVFMGANIDAFAEASKAGIDRQSTQNFVPDSEGVKAAFGSISGASIQYSRTMSKKASSQRERVEEASRIMNDFQEAEEDWEQRNDFNGL